MLFQTPRPRVQELEETNPSRGLSFAAFLPPSCLLVITTGEECGPGISHEVSDQDNEGARDDNQSGFELLLIISSRL